jgi:Transposase and inactivated derivatives
VSCFRFIAAEKEAHSVSLMCRVLGVSRSGFYAWSCRPPSAHLFRDWGVIYHLRRVHQISRQTYGAPRIHRELRAEGIRVGVKRVARLMRQQGLEGSYRRRFRKTTVADESARPAPDLIERDFTATAPNQKWVADFTYVRTWQGWLYLAVVIDVYSRMIVGWSMREDMKADLVVDAAKMAVWRRHLTGRVIHHSDQGAQYVSRAFDTAVADAKLIDLSMGSVGDAFDNAMVESFFATIKTELLDRRSWPTRHEVRLAIYEYIEGWYNPRRRHSALGYLSPADYERIHQEETAQAA